MIIDCHTHIGRGGALQASVDDLLRSMDANGIDHSMVFAGSITHAPNDYVIQQVAPHKDRLYAVAAFRRYTGPGIIVEQGQHIEQLAEWYAEGTIAAVKFYTGYDHYYPRDVSVELSVLEEVGCSVIFHMGDCHNSVKHAKLKYAHPLGIDEMAVDHPKMNFIIAHMGNPWIKEAALVCHKNHNVYADISGFAYGQWTGDDHVAFRNAINQFTSWAPASKLLFGTDWPISDPASYFQAFRSDLPINAKSLSDNVVKAFTL